ncbi:MAG: EAL domain-containing protein [Pseudohongiellaceae bacterium]
MRSGNRHRNAFRIAAIYFAIGAVWIFISDFLLLELISANSETGGISLYQTLKGVIFVVSTALLIYFLVRTALDRQDRILEKINLLKEHHSQILRQIPVGIYQTDSDGILTYHNGMAEELVGLKRNGSPRSEAFSRVVSPDYNNIQQFWNRALANRHLFFEQYALSFENSSPASWVIDHAYPQFDKSGVFIGYLGTVTDITSLKEAQQYALDLRDRLRLALDVGHVAFWDWDLQTDKVYYSEKWKEQLGYTGDEITGNDPALGRRAPTLPATESPSPASIAGGLQGKQSSEWRSRLHPSDEDAAVERLSKFLTNPGEAYSNEFRLRHKDGSYRWFYAQGTMQFDGRGKPQRILGTHTDITSIKESELAVIASQERVQHLLEASPTILYALKFADDKLKADWISESITRILGYSVHEALQKDWWHRNIHPDDTGIAERLDAAIAEGGSIECEYRFYDKIGEIHWLRDFVRAVRTDNDPNSPNEVIGAWIDITDQRKEEEKKRLLSAALASMGDGVIVLDQDLTVLSVNPAFEKISGYLEGSLLGNGPGVLRTDVPDTLSLEDVCGKLKDAYNWNGEIACKTSQDEFIPLWITASVVRSTESAADKYVLICRDISDLKKRNSELRRLAHFDTLTNLPNRLLLMSRLEHAIQKAKRHKHILALLYIDLDDFKSINDSLGHSVGDELLVEVARRFQARVRESDTLARLGGDEFVIVLEDTGSPERIAGIAKDLLQSLTIPFKLSIEREIFAEACIGISVFPQNGDSSETLMQMADTAMYRAKKTGRNRYCFFTAEMGSVVAEHLDIITALRHSVDREELFLEYQPKAGVDGSYVGAEALVRWQRPGIGLVSPSVFIPAAELSGLISPIGAWVINEVARQIRSWLDAGYNPVNIALNISGRQFRDQNLRQLVEQAIERHGIPPACMGLEITESALTEQPEEVEEVLHNLRKLGIQISLDDFGTGFSSFSYLTRFSLDILKIDLSFIRRINLSEKDNKIVIAMLDIANNLNLSTVAEGVETQDQLDFLTANGCTQIQGYLFGRSLAASELPAIMKAARLEPKTGTGGI